MPGPLEIGSAMEVVERRRTICERTGHRTLPPLSRTKDNVLGFWWDYLPISILRLFTACVYI